MSPYYIQNLIKNVKRRIRYDFLFIIVGLPSHAFSWMLCFIPDNLPPPPLSPADTDDRGSRTLSIDEGLHVAHTY